MKSITNFIMETYIVTVNMWDDHFTSQFQGTLEIKASSDDQAIKLAESIEGVICAISVTPL